MKTMTERQIRRREDILTAARKLITELGYDGVTMRQLAKESGVAPKTLYHQFQNKEKLLRAAVEERYRYLYRLIDEAEIERGIDRLYYILDAVSDTTEKNADYARALRPLLTDPSTTGTFTEIRMNTYRKAIDQIASEGEFVDWVDVEMLNALVYRQINPILMRATERIPFRTFAKIDISLILASVTIGYTHDKALEVAKATQQELTS
ncbi:MAG: hypothetical protein CMQ49_14120 [Gammaproteobacteria bacterium]|nr:hypothetical protein [Gammaproteobacteria bacterium]|tara:strand:- start:2572 stop:3195 length:624 start_codon:yes stop_codon:yes gene_type:complete